VEKKQIKLKASRRKEIIKINLLFTNDRWRRTKVEDCPIQLHDFLCSCSNQACDIGEI
jgi:regulation of enolase protein 1 (concanavalin A-like superfamily)